MKHLFEKMNGMMKHFTILDTGMFKLCLISAGILLGIYFFDSLSGVIWLFWTLFALSWLYIVIKVFAVYWHRN